MSEEPQNKKNKESYRSIFKATSLFGGLRVYQILIGIIKAKIIAILLGPAGMGIQGLYQSALDVIKNLTAFGLEQSAVRDISEANGSNDYIRIGRTVAIVRRLVWITGTLGLVVAIVLSPLLSKWTFGNDDYTWGFIILSTTLLLNQICSGQLVLLQGMRRLKDLAKASAIGSTVGLLASIPLYYWIGIKGIVPTMFLISVTALLVSWHYSKKIAIKKVKVTTKESFHNGKSMIKMGVAMSVSGILTTISAYIIRWFIRQQGGIDEVGFYSAGLLITNTYVGMVFSAMGTDYYPRLAAVNKDNRQCSQVINQQGELALLIISPIIVSCVICLPFLIRVIYSAEFMPACKYILFAVSGMIFKAASWTLSYSFLAKAEAKLFIVNETFANIYCLLNNILGYYWGGLMGLGISFIINYFIYYIQVAIISYKRYNIFFRAEFNRIFYVELFFIVLTVVFLQIWSSKLVYIPLFIVFLFCIFFSVRELNNRTFIVTSILNRVPNILNKHS